MFLLKGLRLRIGVLALVIVVAGWAFAQDAAVVGASAPRLGVVRDWSSKHLIFTNGGTPEVAAAELRDPRSLNNWLSRNAGTLGLGRMPRESSSALDEATEGRAR